ncbi:hypothetical protein HNQ36_001051 [Afipia massiliensis]|uniref:ATP-binding protein n=1 Tax=Afipia massiliensis TaxID=211460 RepID=A0A840MY35_9BRAD|nr:ATP-binding protein [Afipia massiliensis]MBB5051097.1 hypothetical protein [Afipia massiliensis]
MIIIDPLGAWWGLRLLADGKTDSKFNVVIFGGDHADLPLNEQAGALLGETAATMAESCIIDLSKLPSRAAERRFMVAFLETIYRKAGGELFHLIVDEADLFAPQNPQKGDEALLGHMDNIVRRGRLRGFIPWLITQRPAVLNKNVLSQVDGLLAFKLTSSQDRDALDAWIEGQADKAQGKAIKDSLPTFPIGEGVVWLPSHGILQRSQFPKKVTFDSSRKPKRGEKLKNRKLKPLNVGKLKEQLATVVEEAKANDPRELRATIAALRKDLASKSLIMQKPTSAPIDKKTVSDAEARGRAIGKVEGYAAGVTDVAKATDLIMKAITPIKSIVANVDLIVPQIQSVIDRASAKHVKAATKEAAKKSGSPAVAPPPPAPPRATVSPAPRASSPAAASGDGSLSNPQAHLLRALAWWLQMGHPQPSRSQLAAIAGWKVGGSNMRGRLSELSSAGLIHYPASGVVALTEAGQAAAPAPDMSATLVDSIKAMLTNPQLQLFNHLLQSGATPITREDLAGAVGWEPAGSNMRGRLSELSAIEVISYPGKGMVSLQDWVVS